MRINIFAIILNVDMKAFILKHPRLSTIIACALLSMIVVLISCSLASFLYPTIAMQHYYSDAATFVIMGKSLGEGKIPYVEVFDHKGLYIFYTTFLYAFLGKFWIFIFMSICMTVSLVFLVFALKELEMNNRTIAFGALFFIALYVFFAQFPGDADLVLMAGAMMFYFYIRGYKRNNDKDHLIACLLAGVSAGFALNMRPSDAMLGFAFMVFYLVKRIMDKKIGIMFRDAALCLLALVITVLPAYIHAYSGNFLNEMVDAVFLSNFRYLGSASDKNVLLVWICRLMVTAIFGGFILLWFFKRKEYQLEESLFIVINSGIILLIQFVIALFPYYLISVSGFMSLAFIITINKYHLLDEEKKSAKPITYAMLSVFCISLLFNPALYLSHLSKDKADIAYIKEAISKEDRKEHTFMFSTYPGLYLNCDVGIIYPDFNAQMFHVNLDEKYSKEKLSAFLQNDEVKYFVTRREFTDVAKELFGSENYVEIPTNLKTVIIIYQHVL